MLLELPPPIVNSRKQTCRCNCNINFESPCASCPKNRWGPQMCEPLINEEVERGFPNIASMAVSAISAVGLEMKATLQKQRALNDEEIQQRYSICESCEFFHKPSKRCKKCGCFMKWKTAWRSQKCPIGKW